jgi:hypothetical protein
VHHGLIKVWGDQDSGGRDAPTGKGYTKIYSTDYAFAALKANGSIKACAFLPPNFGSPHALIEPSALRAAKAYAFE